MKNFAKTAWMLCACLASSPANAQGLAMPDSFDINATLSFPNSSFQTNSIIDSILDKYGLDGVDGSNWPNNYTKISPQNFTKIMNSILESGGSIVIGSANSENQLTCTYNSFTPMKIDNDYFSNRFRSKNKSDNIFGVVDDIKSKNGHLVSTKTYNTKDIEDYSVVKPITWGRYCMLYGAPCDIEKDNTEGIIEIGGGRYIDTNVKQTSATWNGATIKDTELINSINNLIQNHAEKNVSEVRENFRRSTFVTLNKDHSDSVAGTIFDRYYHPDKVEDETKRATLESNANFSASGTYRSEKKYGSEKTIGHAVGLTIDYNF